jgi:PKD repeat protein
MIRLPLLSFTFFFSSLVAFSQCNIVVSTNADAGAGSLRAAIVAANACAGQPTITFSIAAGSTIVLLSDLPSLTHNNTIIDATTSPGFSYSNSMVTIQWSGRDDCLQIDAGNNDVIKGLQFTNNFNGNGDAAIRANAGNNLLVKYCKAFKQNKNLVRVQGATNAVVDNCTVLDFWHNGGSSQKAFEINNGSLIRLSNCTITNVSKKVIELNNSANGGTLGKVTIFNNVFTNVGYGDSSVCAPTPCGMNKGEHVISSYTSHTALFSIRNNTLNGSFSKFIELINSNGTTNNRDSICDNNINDCRGEHTIYIESNSGVYGGVIIQNNNIIGQGINTYNQDQVIEIGGWANNYSDAKITGNLIKDCHGRGIMFRFTDNTLINNNIIYNCSKDQAIELNNDCDNITIQGNFLGTDATSASGLSHFTGHVIQLNECDNCTIGGSRTLNQGNVIIAPNSNIKAIEVSSSSAGTTTIRGNNVNVNPTGTICLSTSGESAIQINGSTAIIGGDSLTFRNIIAGGSGGKGIEIGTSGATIQGNLIGCQKNGAIIQGNGFECGIRLNAGSALIGSTSASNLINKIGYCQKAIKNDDQDNNNWSSNEYWGNTNQSVIDNQGGTPNNNVAPPLISSVNLPNTVSGTGLAGARVEVYFYNQNVSCQGHKYLGFTTVSNNGTWTFTSPVTINQSIAALQISASNASEFICYTVNAFPPTANFSASSTTICAGDCINLTNLSVNNPITYNWTMNGGVPASSTVQNPSVCYSTPGTYTLSLQVSNAGGTNSMSMNILVLPANVSTSQSFALCPGETVTVGPSVYSTAGTFVDTLVSGSGCDSIVTTTISINQTSAFTQNISICDGESVQVGNNTYTTSGTFTDILVNASGCDSVVTTTITLNTNATNNQTITICDGESVTVADSVYDVSGTYVNVINAANGCDSTIITVLIVEDCSSIPENYEAAVVIYPNPTDDLLMLDVGQKLIGATYRIFDQTGRMLLLGTLHSETETISIGALSSGVYSFVLGKDFQIMLQVAKK